MENGKKDILLHLYGEASSESDLRLLLRDEELKKEYIELSEAKFRLDHMDKQRPDQAVIDGILAAAASEAGLPTTSSRQDREPIARHPRLKKMLIPVLSIAAAIVFSIGIGWFGTSSESVSGEFPKALAEHENDLVPPESLFRFVPSRQGGLTQVATSDPRLVWDDSTPLHQVQRRIENMRPTDLLDWGEKAVPLEALPRSSRNRFRTVGSNN